MTGRQDTIFERFLTPVFRLLIDPEALSQQYDSIDWPAARDRLSQVGLTYPDYYCRQTFHGIEGGYLNPSTAVSYDPITQYLLPPSEPLVRQGFIDQIRVQPQRILDLGCGTGSMTLMLKHAFPQAAVTGLDLSPYMLAMAESKAQLANLAIQWRHGDAATTEFPAASFDLITIALLFQETPPLVSRQILHRCQQWLKVGGELMILEGGQGPLSPMTWLNPMFAASDHQDNGGGDLEGGMMAAGFAAVQTMEHWWLHQITRGVKPLSGAEPRAAAVDGFPDPDTLDFEGCPAPAV
ncbi:methyltransferase type 11 [Neosynechococcus sphagnicola sy1]|uniref:Methyltransferase type 11 n=1 Tax=Neosynechococcus sphagnicola sy1 TaxID=1497020 RepID=A0A098TLU4_9CYAN|nr:class I SAM-dependent methyltransferase [Neosynechococcus sphagnicola]KGF72842.1 methyltransferase type 11 [Neosynechococcus sphagnicola sy1]